MKFHINFCFVLGVQVTGVRFDFSSFDDLRGSQHVRNAIEVSTQTKIEFIYRVFNNNNNNPPYLPRFKSFLRVILNFY